MNICHVKCIKDFSNDILQLRVGNKYTTSLCDDGVLLLFIKEGWFKLTEWKEYLEVIKK